MRLNMRLLIVHGFLALQVLFALLFAGCGATFDFDAVRRLDPGTGGFADALSREYRSLALFEADQMYDWPDAARYGAKALRAAGGDAAAPERPADWRLPAEAVGAVTAARRRLVAALEGGAGRRFAADAARAQARFDCWLEQQEENWQTAHIARCRDGFHAALRRLESGLARAEAFTLFFPFDSAETGAEGADTMDTVAAAAAAGKRLHVVLAGHADRAGPRAYNQGLSRRRALAVRDALMARGIDGGRITTTAFGETRPRVATPDGLREPRNRRVEIMVGPAPAL